MVVPVMISNAPAYISHSALYVTAFTVILVVAFHLFQIQQPFGANCN